MSGSSGIPRIIFAECQNADVCDWAGEVDEMFDPEFLTAWWECPACSHQHDASVEFLTDDRGEDA